MGKAPSSSARPKGPPGGDAALQVTKKEIIATRELLESVMTLASHGILFRVGEILGESVLEAARAQGGPLPEAAARVLVGRHFAEDVRFFPTRVQVKGSIEAGESAEPTCHIMRGLLHKLVCAEGGAFFVREESCASQGADGCVFAVRRGGGPR